MAHRFRTKQPTAADAIRRKQYTSREHRELRAAWQRRIDNGEPVPCTRRLPGCVGVITRGIAWHLDHDDNDRTRYRGPACARCNVKAAARKGNRVARARKATVRPVRRRDLLG